MFLITARDIDSWPPSFAFHIAKWLLHFGAAMSDADMQLMEVNWPGLYELLQ